MTEFIWPIITILVGAFGLIQGEAVEGKGLWHDCVDSIVQGIQPNKLAPGMTIPTVPAQVVAACKAKHPHFGESKVGK